MPSRSLSCCQRVYSRSGTLSRRAINSSKARSSRSSRSSIAPSRSAPSPGAGGATGSAAAAGSGVSPPSSCCQRSSFWPGRRSSRATSSRLSEPVEGLRDLGDRVEAVQPLAALLELADRLRPAEHEHAEQRDLRLRQPERLVEELPVFQRTTARPARKARPATIRHALERCLDLALLVRDDRIPVRRLVARQAKRVQRERVGIRRRPLLLDQAAEDADLDGVDVHAQSLETVPGRELQSGRTRT